MIKKEILTQPQVFAEEPEARLQLDHSQQLSEDPRFTITKSGIATTNYDTVADIYGHDTIPHVKKGFELEYERFNIQLRRALEDRDFGLFEQPYQEEFGQLNQELVELDRFVYTCYGLDLIGLINDRNQYQEQVNRYFQQSTI
ncbi:hypothetical protein KAZ66_01680 [Candidatus Woesebacteria bacterium]|nr:hypothetical protein [Candidatus Woesebacteria bacterium]